MKITRQNFHCCNVFAWFLFLTIVNVALPLTLQADDPTNTKDSLARLKRSESFFGVHFDFHASKDVANIGATTTPEMVQAIIDSLHPDFIQIDCKGHPGWSSYPTKVGNAAPGVVADSLKIWREVTAQNCVALYTHYSGVWDGAAVANRPEWAVVNADGSVSKEKTSVFGAYKDELLIPQLLELALEYGVDGVWLDGECWATVPDYSAKAQEAFKTATGKSEIPKSPVQDNWEEWFSFHQEAYRNYLKSYVDAVKAKACNFQIASNWAFTDHMPDSVCANVDFISGDFSPNDSVNAARYSTRLMENQNKPWDLMAWSFSTVNNNWQPKTAVQLSREAACVMAQGGSFQAYITQNQDGSVNLDKLPPMAETGKFCRARQAFCQNSTLVPQVTLFCPTKRHYKNTATAGGQQLFPMITWQRPILNRLLELNYAVDIQLDSMLSQSINASKAVVFYRGDLWSDELKSNVIDYVKRGGAIVLIGNESLNEMRTTLSGAQKEYAENIDNTWFLDVYAYGKGKIVVFPTPVDSPQEFVEANGPIFNALLKKAMEKAFATPLVQLSQQLPLDVSVRRTQNGNLSIHFVNVSGPHAQAGVIDSIEPVDNVEITLNLTQKPKSIRLEPVGDAIDFEWNGTQARLTIPSIQIHEIIIIEE